MKLSSKIYSGIIFAFLFAPIAVLLVFSFNESKSLSVFSGAAERQEYTGIRQEYTDSGRLRHRVVHRSRNLGGGRHP